MIECCEKAKSGAVRKRRRLAAYGATNGEAEGGRKGFPQQVY
jgi:hypothetical protein